MPQPNIVYILNDHQAFYGHQAKRPVFDQFAAQGIQFDRAYTVCPLCGPARRSMLTSLFPHNHRELKNDDDHPYDRETYLDVLGTNGYDQYYFGKWHAGSGTALDHGCKGFNYPSYSNPYNKPEYQEYLKEMGFDFPRIFIEDDFMNWARTDRDGQVVKQDGDWCNEHSSGVMLAQKEAHEAFFLAHLAKKQLGEISKRKGSNPFHLRIDFWGPHQPYFPTEDYAKLYNEKDIRLPLSFKENVYKNNKPDCYATEYNKGISKDGKLLFPNPVSENVWRRVLARCYAQVSLVDAAAGVILDALREYGLEDNTIVIMTTDHGDGLACHGGHFDKASYMPEEMLRIPMALRYPNVIPTGQVSHRLVSNMDVGVTMLDSAGLKYSQPVDGQSLLPLCKQEPITWRETLVCETHGHMEDHIGRALYWDDYKFVYNKDQLNELYHLTKDPWELVNLVSEPEYDHVRSEAMRRLAAHEKESDDRALAGITA